MVVRCALIHVADSRGNLLTSDHSAAHAPAFETAQLICNGGGTSSRATQRAQGNFYVAGGLRPTVSGCQFIAPMPISSAECKCRVGLQRLEAEEPTRHWTLRC